MLSGNTLKLIAAVCMMTDHIGLILLPEARLLRIIGRLAYPIFAYMIAEGCRYTKNPKRYFMQIAAVAALCQVVYYVYEHSLDMCILVTFCMSVAVIFAFGRFKNASALTEKCFRTIEFCTTVAIVYVLNVYFDIFACFFSYEKVRHNLSVFGIGLTVLAIDYGGVQWYSLLAVPLLMLYNGQRGRRNMKYFFYIFYPVHMLALELVAILTA